MLAQLNNIYHKIAGELQLGFYFENDKYYA
jgi:hypothetical protein